MSEVTARSEPLPRRSLEPLLFRALGFAFALFIATYILIPILVTLVMSFNEAAMIRFPIEAWSVKWYADFFGSEQWTTALENSIVIAIGTTLWFAKWFIEHALQRSFIKINCCKNFTDCSDMFCRT